MLSKPVFIEILNSESSTQHIDGDAVTFVLPDKDSSLIVLQWGQEQSEWNELYLADGYYFGAQKQRFRFNQQFDERNAA